MYYGIKQILLGILLGTLMFLLVEPLLFHQVKFTENLLQPFPKEPVSPHISFAQQPFIMPQNLFKMKTPSVWAVKLNHVVNQQVEATIKNLQEHDLPAYLADSKSEIIIGPVVNKSDAKLILLKLSNLGYMGQIITYTLENKN